MFGFRAASAALQNSLRLIGASGQRLSDSSLPIQKR